MIQTRSKLKNCDNSGAKWVRCIKVLRGSTGKTKCKLGDIVLASVIKHDSSKLPLKQKMYKCLVIGLKANSFRKKGEYIRFSYNRSLLLSNQYKFLGTRVYGAICREIRGGSNEEKYRKIISYSEKPV